MAVAFDTASSATAVAGVSSANWSHTASGSNRLGVVGAALYATSNSGNGSISSATWNSVSMTSWGESAAGLSGSRSDMFRIVAPPTSSVTVALTFTEACHGVCGSMTFTGVDQTTPVDATVEDEGSGVSSISVNVSSATDDMVADCAYSWNTTPSVGANQTSRWSGNSGTDEQGGQSTEAGGATITMSWTGGSDMSIVAGNINAAVGPALQTVRPDGDVAIGSGWQDEGAATTNLYQSIDETSTDDADYVTVTV